MDQRDATRFAIAQARHNMTVIAEELSHRTNLQYARREATRFARQKTVGWLWQKLKTPLIVVVVGAAVGTASYFTYRRFVS